MSIFRFNTCIEVHYICMLSINFSILHWFYLKFGNHTNLFCHAVIVGN